MFAFSGLSLEEIGVRHRRGGGDGRRAGCAMPARARGARSRMKGRAMSDHDTPDPVDKTYVEAETVLNDEAARAARRAQLLAVVEQDARAPVMAAASAAAALTVRRRLRPAWRPNWRRNSWRLGGGAVSRLLGVVLRRAGSPADRALCRQASSAAGPRPHAANPTSLGRPKTRPAAAGRRGNGSDRFEDTTAACSLPRRSTRLLMMAGRRSWRLHRCLRRPRSCAPPSPRLRPP